MDFKGKDWMGNAAMNSSYDQYSNIPLNTIDTMMRLDAPLLSLFSPRTMKSNLMSRENFFSEFLMRNDGWNLLYFHIRVLYCFFIAANLSELFLVRLFLIQLLERRFRLELQRAWWPGYLEVHFFPSLQLLKVCQQNYKGRNHTTGLEWSACGRKS